MKKGSSFVILIFLFITLLAACKVKDISTPPATLTLIVVTPTDPSIAPGTTTQLTAIGIYSNNNRVNITSSVTWTSSDPGIADIGNTAGTHGLVTATTTTGSTIITATSGGISGSTTLTMSHVASMSVTPSPPPSIAPGTMVQYVAIGTLLNSAQQNLTTFATWTSENSGVALVSDAAGSKGLTSAVSAATTTITATYDGVSGSAAFKSSTLSSLAVTPIAPSIAKGTTQQFTATGHLADLTLQSLTSVATWSSSTIGIATISNAGLATAVSEGTTTILASFTSITSLPATLGVTPEVITAITVTPVNPSIVLGKTQQFIAIGTFSDVSTQDISSSATWNSSDINIATISNILGSKGLATSVNTGSTTITASSGGFSGSTTLTVTPVVLESIEVRPATFTIFTSSGIVNEQFTAIGHFSDNSTQDLTTSVIWSSSTNVANISNTPGSKGLATITFAIGTADITATFSGITSNPATLIVTNLL